MGGGGLGGGGRLALGFGGEKNKSEGPKGGGWIWGFGGWGGLEVFGGVWGGGGREVGGGDLERFFFLGLCDHFFFFLHFCFCLVVCFSLLVFLWFCFFFFFFVFFSVFFFFFFCLPLLLVGFNYFLLWV